MASEVPTCGICRKALRHGENPTKIRIAIADMNDKKYPVVKAEGLYQSCQECHDVYLPEVAKRLGKKVEDMTAHDAL